MTLAMALLYQCEEGGGAGGRFLVPQHETAGLTPLFTAPIGPQTSTALQLPNDHKKTRRERRVLEEAKMNYFSLISLYSTCLRALGSNFMISILSGVVFLFLVVV
jgi:hypothetical protein